jgi:hypothetical protein
MPYILSREVVLAEKLLALAEHWRNSAEQADEPWRHDMMIATANEFEQAAARASSLLLKSHPG